MILKTNRKTSGTIIATWKYPLPYRYNVDISNNLNSLWFSYNQITQISSLYVKTYHKQFFIKELQTYC